MTIKSSFIGTERTGWRGEQWLSTRHRHWGGCYATDIDFLMVEYNQGLPVAIVDYKCRFPVLLGSNANYTAQRTLANAAGIPFWITYYSPSENFYGVQPMNTYAMRFWRCDELLLSEWQYVNAMYILRGYRNGVPSRIGANLSTVIPTKATWPRIEPNQG